MSPSQCASSHCPSSLNASNLTTHSTVIHSILTNVGTSWVSMYIIMVGEMVWIHTLQYMLFEWRVNMMISCNGLSSVMLLLSYWTGEKTKKHHQKTVSINPTSNFIRVLEAVYGPLSGHPQFIPHTTTNTEYLQEDCLRFRVSMIKWPHHIIPTHACTIEQSSQGYQQSSIKAMHEILKQANQWMARFICWFVCTLFMFLIKL